MNVSSTALVAVVTAVGISVMLSVVGPEICIMSLCINCNRLNFHTLKTCYKLKVQAATKTVKMARLVFETDY